MWLKYVFLAAISIGLTLLLVACKPQSNHQTEGSSADSTAPGLERCEDYPEGQLIMGYNEVVPPLAWENAYEADGTRSSFSFENFFCGEAYANHSTLILVIGAGWCQSCTRLTKMHVNPVATELTEDLGAEIVYIEIQDKQYQTADSQFAYRHLQSLISDGPGWRVGDLDTLMRDGNSMKSMMGFISQQMNLPTLPAIWVVRRRDMRIIATRELAWQSRPGELPLIQIAGNPEGEWSDPPLPPFQSQCQAGDDEEAADTSNDVQAHSVLIEPGTYEGGICDPAPDFYRFDIAGSWQLTLDHDVEIGDLDLILWDRERDAAALDENGRIIASLSAESPERLSGEGPAIIQIRGYGGSSATYTLTLTAF